MLSTGRRQGEESDDGDLLGPGVNNHKKFGRWVFAEFCDVYEMADDFETRVEAHFNQMIDAVTQKRVGEVAHGAE